MTRFLPLVLIVVVCLYAGTCAAGQPEEIPQDVSGSADATVDLSRLMPQQQPAASPPTSNTVLLLTGYSILIVLASLVGGWLPSWIHLSHTRMQTAISFVGGLMLGIGVLHLMPHSVYELNDASATAHWMMVGVVVMFVLMRLFHFHNHEPINQSHEMHQHSCGHDHDDGHVSPDSTGEEHSTAECHTHGHSHGISWIGIAFGLSFHTLIDGMALGVAVHSESQRPTVWGLCGLGTFLAIVFHKPLDAVSITSLMAASGREKHSRNLVNAGFAMMCPLGAMLALAGITQFAGYQKELVGGALAFSAGVFICISLSDLLPEMEFHSHNKVQLTSALGLGIIVAWVMTLLHPAHM